MILSIPCGPKLLLNILAILCTAMALVSTQSIPESSVVSCLTSNDIPNSSEMILPSSINKVYNNILVFW
ncbi:hypothetical protein EHP00_2125 [Ecytonucleospora hepatopenaei]|uniref:Uncharacterized protein n=1 Tax=Ecytonucleospora hepatopenaei TaxID=646526 RepID=A0A1W0E4T0_9MICR|nr:hypothetical protein EHP00_2125 [Ecytonucleospora hepatopenaei]